MPTYVRRNQILVRSDTDRRLSAYYNRQPDEREITHRGTRIYGGRLWVDPNPDMRDNQQAQEIYSEMEHTDPLIGGASIMLDGVLQTARLGLEPANKTQVAGRMMEFADWALNVTAKRRPSAKTLAENIRPLQTFAARGFAYAEIVPKVVVPRSGKFKGRPRVVLGGLEFCEQASHADWVLDKTGRRLVGITQHPAPHADTPKPPKDAPTYNGLRVAVVERLVRLAFHGRGHNYQGIPLYRRLVFPWRAKNSAMDSGLIAIKRFGSPTPTLKFDRRAALERGYTDTQFDGMVDRAIDNIEAYFVDEHGYLAAYPGIEYDTFGGKSVDSRHVVDFVKLCNREILLGMLAQFFSLGIGDVGSRSVGTIHRTVHAQFVANLMTMIAKMITEQVIYGIIAWNFGTRVADDNTPRLTHHDIDAAQLGEALALLPGLVQSGILKPTQALENEVIRTLAGAKSSHALIEQSERVDESVRFRQAQGGVFKPGPGRPQGEDG